MIDEIFFFFGWSGGMNELFTDSDWCSGGICGVCDLVLDWIVLCCIGPFRLRLRLMNIGA